MMTSNACNPAEVHFVTRGPNLTRKLASDLAGILRGDEIIHLHGGLGTGKTCFIQGLAQGLQVGRSFPVTSPTFTLINEYSGRVPLFHVDLYRLDRPEEIYQLGLEDYFGRGVLAIEWAERLPPGLEQCDLEIRFKAVSDRIRRIILSEKTGGSPSLITTLRDILSPG